MKSVHWQAVVKADNVHSHNSLHHEEENLVHQVFSGQDDCASSFLSPPPPHPRVVVVTVGLSRRCRATPSTTSVAARPINRERADEEEFICLVWFPAAAPTQTSDSRMEWKILCLSENGELQSEERLLMKLVQDGRWVNVSSPSYVFVEFNQIDLCPAAVVKHLHDDLWPPPLPVLRL